MKQISPAAILFLVLMLVNSSSSHVSDGVFLPKTQLDEKKTTETALQPLQFLPEDDFSTVMGLLEDCGNTEEDEGCVKRRMLSEAHLDYIYTQNHKP